MDSPNVSNDGYGLVDLSQLALYRLDTMDILPGMRVEALNGSLGIVDEVIFEVSIGRVTYLLVKKGEGLTRDALIPVEWIAQLERDRVLLAVRIEQVEAYADRPSDYSESGN